MVRAALVTATSLALTGAVVAHAYFLKHQFYPTVVYLTKSSPSMAVSAYKFFTYHTIHWESTSTSQFVIIIYLLCFITHVISATYFPKQDEYSAKTHGEQNCF